MTWYYQQWSEADEYSADMFYNRCWWETVFAWKPVQCDLTGKKLWLKRVRKGTSVWPFGDRNMYEYRYHETKQHLVWVLSR